LERHAQHSAMAHGMKVTPDAVKELVTVLQGIFF
jgi:hypothetical protein